MACRRKVLLSYPRKSFKVTVRFGYLNSLNTVKIFQIALNPGKLETLILQRY